MGFHCHVGSVGCGCILASHRHRCSRRSSDFSRCCDRFSRQAAMLNITCMDSMTVITQTDSILAAPPYRLIHHKQTKPCRPVPAFQRSNNQGGATQVVPPLTLSPAAPTFPPTECRRLLHPHHRTSRPTEQCACALSKPYHELKSPPAANPRCAHSFYGVRPFSGLSPFEPAGPPGQRQRKTGIANGAAVADADADAGLRDRQRPAVIWSRHRSNLTKAKLRG